MDTSIEVARLANEHRAAQLDWCWARLLGWTTTLDIAAPGRSRYACYPLRALRRSAAVSRSNFPQVLNLPSLLCMSMNQSPCRWKLGAQAFFDRLTVPGEFALPDEISRFVCQEGGKVN